MVVRGVSVLVTVVISYMDGLLVTYEVDSKCFTSVGHLSGD